MSKINHGEAEILVQFFAYLVLNGTTPGEITVLTFYNGQRKLIMRKLREHRHLQGATFNVVTVDSYQGEENEVVGFIARYLVFFLRKPPHFDVISRYYCPSLGATFAAILAFWRSKTGFVLRYLEVGVDSLSSATRRTFASPVCCGGISSKL